MENKENKINLLSMNNKILQGKVNKLTLTNSNFNNLNNGLGTLSSNSSKPPSQQNSNKRLYVKQIDNKSQN